MGCQVDKQKKIRLSNQERVHNCISHCQTKGGAHITFEFTHGDDIGMTRLKGQEEMMSTIFMQ
jgi:hypothetical protein